MDIQRFERDSTKIGTHRIELDIIIPPTYYAKYILNPNYATIFKQDINNLLAIGFIKFVEEATWLSPIVVVPKKNGKLRICIDFRELNLATKKDPYPLPFIDEVLNKVTGYEATYFFLDGYLAYHQISIALEDRYKITFVID
jgi:hypothetical protein